MQVLERFIRIAEVIIQGAGPQDHFPTQMQSDLRYESGLKSLTLLARHHISPLSTQMYCWRDDSHGQLKARFPPAGGGSHERILGFCKRAAVDLVFMEAALVMFAGHCPEEMREGEFLMFQSKVIGLAFENLLYLDEMLPSECTNLRSHTLATCNKVLGAASRMQLWQVADSFFKNLNTLKATPKSSILKVDHELMRKQMIRMAGGMGSVSLAFCSDEQLTAATVFLQSSFPLHHIAKEKKSQLHHALCEMLTNILAPLIRLDQPHGCSSLSPALMTAWYSQVLFTKTEIEKWMVKHVKHIQEGYPLVTVLVCLTDDDSYASGVDATADLMLKGMKTKELRALCAKCLVRLASSYLTRYGGIMPRPELIKWLDKVLKPIVALCKKGGLTVTEMTEFIEGLQAQAPDYVISSIILELLGSEVPDCVLAGLRSLHAMLTSDPTAQPVVTTAVSMSTRLSTGRSSPLSLLSSSSALSSAASNATSISRTSVVTGVSSGGTFPPLSISLNRLAPGSTSGASPRGMTTQQTLGSLRRGNHPLDQLGCGYLLPRLIAALSKLLTQFHGQYGGGGGASGAGGGGGGGQENKERTQGMAMFTWLLCLLPLLRPELWTGPRPLELLPGYAANSESQVRNCAYETQKNIVTAVPHARNAVLLSCASYVCSLHDDATQVCLVQARI
ncbi:MAG: hypothetical protein WDW38_002842 [Sanguina aurantia]